MKTAALLVLVAMPALAESSVEVTDPSSPSSGVHLIGDVRGIFLFRAYEDYNRHASIWGYDVPDAAGGIAATLGAQLSTRWSVFAGGQYVVNGSDRGNSHLRLASGGGMLLGRFVFAHAADDDTSFDVGAVAGLGRYAIRETYVNVDLSPQVYVQSGGGFGGQAGADLTFTKGVFRAVLAYAYHYSPASISDNLGGVVYAGGHEISIGVGVRL